MSILHGDNRFYNNIFLQTYHADDDDTKVRLGYERGDNTTVGTAIFNGYPTYEEWINWFELDQPANMGKMAQYHFAHLPVWSRGNAYLGGARAWEHETDFFTDEAAGAYVQLVEKNGQYTLKTNVYELLGNFRDAIVDSDTLGYAFEPEQRFEDPDGSTIVFNSDFFGNHRGISALPGPFAEAATTYEMPQDVG